MKSRTARHILSITTSLTLIAAILSVNLPTVLAAVGDFDNTFDGNGRLATDFDGGDDIVNDIVIQPDGKIVAVGSTDPASGTELSAVARYNSNGSLDTTFGGDGRVTIFPASLGGSALNAVAIQPDGKIVVVGRVANAALGGDQMTIIRLSSSGDLDSSFSGDGVINNAFPDRSQANAVAIQPNGAVIVAGSVGPSTSMGVARFTSAGIPDSTFSQDGITTIDFGAGSFESAEGVHVLPSGQILVGGTYSNGFALGRLNSNGTPDTTFDLDGEVTTDIQGGLDSANDMKVQSDGKIVLAGRSGFTLDDTTLIRYNPNGNLDETFDGDGVVVTSVGGQDRAHKIAFQSDGKIIAVTSSTGFDFEILRYNPNGSLDSTFGVNGLLRTDLTNGSTDTSNAVAIQADGKIVVAGSTQNTTAGATTNFCLARYLNGGATTFDFDADGRSDVSLWRQSNGTWYVGRSGLGDMYVQPWGLNGDVIVPADYDGDRKTDLAVRRPSDNNFYVFNSSNSTVEVRNFGIAGDIAVPSDYNGDGKADVAVWRPSNGTWYLSLSGSGIFYVMPWGFATDKPAPGDFDGDGKTDLAVFRPSEGKWYMFNTVTNVFSTNEWGLNGDRPVQGDYNGDGRTDFAVFRPSNNTWYRQNSNDGAISTTQWGLPNDFLVPGDYDGDGKIDVAVWRPSDATWYINRSGSGFFSQTFGVNGDTPIPGAFVR